jgi:hypothetical protein
MTIDPPALIARQVVGVLRGDVDLLFLALRELIEQRLFLVGAIQLPEAEPDEQRHAQHGQHDAEQARSPGAGGRGWGGSSHDILIAIRRFGSGGCSMVKIFLIAGLCAIVLSLASGLFYLVTDKGESKKMVNALSVRVGLSVLLFLLLLLAWSQGLIKPNGM